MGQSNKTRTVLGDDCHMSGELILENDAVIEGEFNGTLRVNGELDLPKTAQVTGMVVVGTLRLAGRARADVIATESVELVAGAELNGRVFTPHLTMGHGVVFQGEATVGPASASAAERLLRQSPAADPRRIDGLDTDQERPPPPESATTSRPAGQDVVREAPLEAPLSPGASLPESAQTNQGQPDFSMPSSSDELSTSESAFAGDGSQANEPDFGTMLESVQKVLRRRRPAKVLSTDGPERAT